MPSSKRTAILLISCPDQPGIVSAVSSFIGNHNGNIVYLDQHVDSRAGLFFMRIEWETENLALSDDDFLETFNNEIAEDLKLNWQIHYSDQVPRTAIFVTKDAHCLYDLLSRHESGEL
ncbi:MAG: ACT domain-containing protein [Verrucomicrobiales bacterium]